MRRPDSSGREDHLTTASRAALLAVLAPAHAGYALPVEFQRLDETPGFELKVFSVQHGLEKTARGRPAAAAFLVDVEVANPLVVAGIEILDCRDAILVRRGTERVKNFPSGAWKLNPPFAAGAVVFGFQKMINVFPKIRRYVVP